MGANLRWVNRPVDEDTLCARLLPPARTINRRSRSVNPRRQGQDNPENPPNCGAYNARIAPRDGRTAFPRKGLRWLRRNRMVCYQAEMDGAPSIVGSRADRAKMEPGSYSRPTRGAIE